MTQYFKATLMGIYYNETGVGCCLRFYFFGPGLSHMYTELQVEQWPNDLQEGSNPWSHLACIQLLTWNEFYINITKKDIANNLKIQKFLINKFR